MTEIVPTDQYILEYNIIDAALESAKINAIMPSKGINVRKPNDCLITAMPFNLIKNFTTMTLTLISFLPISN